MSSAPKLAIIDPGMGNLRSVCRAWEHVGADVHLAASPKEVGDPDALVFPGQGGMPHCMNALRQTGFDAVIREWISADKPYFGICLGMQALFEYSEEGDSRALGIFSGKVKKFKLGPEYKIPHMGWNAVQFSDPAHSAVAGVENGAQFYFVHSYRVETDDANLVWGETEYGERFVSAIRRGNCYATQFHPEKSQAKGLQIYRNFVESVSIC
ncbi:imidazole glycerol phosphate synthase subunit HisH [Cerasicoccus arenae]|uniref:Imidazole glycerol phosphate synthase subunit HisH n=1 Tax=Cerasicoccus arenae TaxID=424488 RepID=A0A8J3DDM3_9BACT|nr:imidazole glycerol phosphate synthase subunit HisH [Cerasicoccus arenae]MBK1859402.1 imidazole glycerol phosphate synthase subunit HisH [Cerasicoccus arenae]GHC10786.1 imidazole glycerol phosphate synthase subunit HisH [Cerasicoccus arenae]